MIYAGPLSMNSDRQHLIKCPPAPPQAPLPLGLLGLFIFSGFLFLEKYSLVSLISLFSAVLFLNHNAFLTRMRMLSVEETWSKAPESLMSIYESGLSAQGHQEVRAIGNTS